MTPLDRLGIGNLDPGTMTLADLKALVRKDAVFKHYGLSGTNVAFMTRDECVSFLTTGETSFRARLELLGNRGERRAASKAGEAREEVRDAGGAPASRQAELEKAFDILAGLVNPASDTELEARLLSYIDSRLESMPARRIEVVACETVRAVPEVVHERFELVLKCIAASVPCALVGPAGSGKSTICEQAAESLGLEARAMSFNPLSSKSDILGFIDANGKYHMSLFRLCFEFGGLFIADEFDAAHPGIAVILNAAVANRKCSFADNVTVTAHPDFRFAACLNTYGMGATVEYVGRNRLDAATLDRFAFIWLDYDKSLEPKVIHATVPRQRVIPDYGANPVKDADHWLSIVSGYRKAAAKLGLRHIISPRASILGMQLAAQGVGVTWLVPMLITKGLAGEDLTNLERENLTQ